LGKHRKRESVQRNSFLIVLLAHPFKTGCDSLGVLIAELFPHTYGE
jgi:hypothetical protein